MTLRQGIRQTRFYQAMVKAWAPVLLRLAPNWTYRQVDDLLLTPRKNKTTALKIPGSIKSFTIPTPQGRIRAYEQGQGPTVVLVHGWSASAQVYFPLMRGLAQLGFRALAFDHFAHGQSEGQQASLKRFIFAVNHVLHHVQKRSTDGLAALVGHSMGCVAVANIPPTQIGETPLFFISPVFNFRKYYTKQVHLLGLHPSLSKQYLSRFEQNYKNDLERMELALKLAPLAGQTVIAHDRSDDETPFVDSVKFCADHPLTRLLVTRGLGHQRIINSESVWQQLKAHLNYEDITANPFQKCS